MLSGSFREVFKEDRILVIVYEELVFYGLKFRRVFDVSERSDQVFFRDSRLIRKIHRIRGQRGIEDVVSGRVRGDDHKDQNESSRDGFFQLKIFSSAHLEIVGDEHDDIKTDHEHRRHASSHQEIVGDADLIDRQDQKRDERGPEHRIFLVLSDDQDEPENEIEEDEHDVVLKKMKRSIEFPDESVRAGGIRIRGIKRSEKHQTDDRRNDILRSEDGLQDRFEERCFCGGIFGVFVSAVSISARHDDLADAHRENADRGPW